jgi:sterol desaturase/sphingolipid hydroxylase (fatty acid hydroxylase superfamily)
MTTLEILDLVPPILFVAFHIAEWLSPARRSPRSFGWRLRGLLWFLASGALFANAPRLWTGWAAEHSLFDTAALGFWGAVPAVFVANFIGYGWHRLRHALPPLWRLHQLHHAAERLDISGAFMFHPIETVVEALLFSVSSVLILGVTPEAAALAGTFGFFCATFQHANVRTPQWLGYFVQRPESHSVHHGRGIHAGNYADLPIFDLLFGTWKNPQQQETLVGFYDGASRRLGRMLFALDVTQPPLSTEGPATPHLTVQ